MFVRIYLLMHVLGMHVIMIHLPNVGGYVVDVDETAIGVGLSTLGVDLDTIGNVDAAEALSSSYITEKRRKSQEKYGLQTTLNLKATNDVYRQELHKERSER